MERREEPLPPGSEGIFARAAAETTDTPPSKRRRGIAIKRLKRRVKQGSATDQDQLGLARLLVEAGRFEDALAVYNSLELPTELAPLGAARKAHCLLLLGRAADAWSTMPRPAPDAASRALCKRIAGEVEPASEGSCVRGDP